MQSALRAHIEFFYTDQPHEPRSVITMSVSISAARAIFAKGNLHSYFNFVQVPLITLFLILHKSLSGVMIRELLSSIEN